MRNQIDCFVAIASAGDAEATIETLSWSVSVRDITLMIEPQTAQAYPQAQVIETESLTSTATLAEIARRATAPYVLLTLKAQPILWGDHAIERMVETAADTGAGMVYADSRMATADGKLVAHPAIDYQKGALRDDFDFGPAVLVSTALLKGYMAPAARRPRLPMGCVVRPAPLHLAPSRHHPPQRVSLHPAADRQPRQRCAPV